MTIAKNLIVAMIIFSLVVFFTGCPEANHRVIVFVIDMSASIEPGGRLKAFDALSAWLSQKKLKRGDKIILIPVTGDAWSESQGMIHRFTISEKREAYDGDLTRLEGEVKLQLEEMERLAAEKPYQKTDLFGALKLVSAELQNETKDSNKTVIVLGDLMQDDSTANFKTAPYLENTKAAISQARTFAGEQSNNYFGCRIFLGFLRSSDLKSLKPKRREALEAFWIEYFRQGNAADVLSAIDGPGQIDLVLNEAPAR